MYYSYVEIEYVGTSFSPARTDLALKLLSGGGRERFGWERSLLLLLCLHPEILVSGTKDSSVSHCAKF
jgi:hypothetical protein